MKMDFQLVVLYGTIAVFAAGMEDPFNDWTPEHVAQGFTWRPGSVSFATLIDGGITIVTVLEDKKISPNLAATRAIAVPFTINHSGKFEVATIGEERTFTMVPGDYALLFQTGIYEHSAKRGDPVMWCHLTFVPTDTQIEPSILVSDRQLSPKYPLLMAAEPA